MSYQRKRVNEEAAPERSVQAASAPRPREATDVIWPRHRAHAFVFKRPQRDHDEDDTTIFERVHELETSDILSDENGHALAIEGGLARSIMPHGRSWKRRALWLTSSVGLLAAVAVWSSDWRSWASLSERTPVLHAVPLARSEPVAPAPIAQPQATAPQPEPVAAAPGGTLDVTPAMEETTSAPNTKSAKATRQGHRGASLHKAHAKLTRGKHGALARRIQPLPEPNMDGDEAAAPSAANATEGTLQINSRPWARIVVDGSFVGHTPQRALHLAAGKHRVQLVNDEMDMSKIIDLTIAPGQTIKRIETLDDNTAAN